MLDVSTSHHWKIPAILKTWGPGLIVMLADTDAGCLITAAQSGAQWGYTMILPQIVLIPILYMVQEITVRLGIVTKKGHGTLIRENFGRGWAWLAAGTLAISSIGALLTEFAGVAGVGQLFGVSKWVTIPIATVILIAIAFLGSYRRTEKIGILFGLGELAFIIAMLMVHPDLHAMGQGMLTIPWRHSSYVYLVAANVGAVIMPWMIFYQQSAIVDKHLAVTAIKKERHDTFFGTLLTQGIMLVFIITFAATLYHSGAHRPLGTVVEMANGLAPFLGTWPTRILLGVSMLGGAMVAALVVALAGTWGITEVLNWHHSLNEPFNRKSAGFYIIYVLAHVIGAVLVLVNFDIVGLAVTVEVINALMLPIVLGFLLVLEATALPPKYRMHGWYKWLVWILSGIVMAFGLYMIGPTLQLW
ncbi:NRAMP family divalent metal transporter [Limosilactobacillus sp.]|uniref:NRAMP family divalent metal transporter n=1 Tax=Limosilactobacillus sp. TaxID=2773925 RepID=UPI00345E9DB5